MKFSTLHVSKLETGKDKWAERGSFLQREFSFPQKSQNSYNIFSLKRQLS